MTLTEKMILGKCRGGMSTVAEGSLTFRWYIILMLKFPKILDYITKFVHK
jgi:hypothetical protein